MFPISKISKTGALCACILIAAGCASDREPFARQYERAPEQCLSASEFARIGGDAGRNALASNNAAFIDGHPMTYVVRKGDTLWDISGRFLRKPWYWRQVWRSNPQIKNPHLIYPGDVLSIVTVNGQKYLTISESRNPYHGTDTGRRTSDGRPIVRLDPGMVQPELPGSPAAISQSILGPFLTKSRIVSLGDLQRLPFIFGRGEQYLTLSQQGVVYTQGLIGERGTKLGVYRPGAPIIDYNVELKKPRFERDKPEILGQQMQYIGEVTILGYDTSKDLTELQPTDVIQAMQEGDVLMPLDDSAAQVNYFPQLPSNRCQRGYILNNVRDQSIRITEYDTVITSFGRDNGAEVGDVWAIERQGSMRVINGQPVAIPGERVGFLMIYKVYDRVSEAVVLDSTQPITETDYLVHP